MLLGSWGDCSRTLSEREPMPEGAGDCIDRYYPDAELIEDCIYAIQEAEQRLNE